MAKKTGKSTDDDRDEREERERDEREERDRDERESREEIPPPEQIAVDYGDGVYQIIDAPAGGGPRAIVVMIDGHHYQHVDEHEGLWAYRNLDPPDPPAEPPPAPEPEVKV